MHLSCDRHELGEALALTSLVAPARTTRPLLANLCFVVEPPGLEVLATDLEVGVRVRCQRVDADSEGRFLLNAAHTAAILREIGDDRVEITCEDEVATIAAGGSQFRLVAGRGEEFPVVPPFAGAGGFAIERAQLESMLRKTAFAAAAEGLRYALNGVQFEVGGGAIRLVATDGKRLAICERPLEHPEGLEVARVVSNKAVALLARLAAPEDEQLRLAFEENQVLAMSSRASFAAQLVQGHFPPYATVIPKGLDKRIELEAGPFGAALRKASLLTTKDSYAVRFCFGHNLLTLTSRAPGIGEGKVELVIAYDHEPLETAYNPDYLAAVLKVLDGTRLVLELREATLPCVISEGEGFRYIVMPIDLA